MNGITVKKSHLTLVNWIRKYVDEGKELCLPYIILRAGISLTFNANELNISTVVPTDSVVILQEGFPGSWLSSYGMQPYDESRCICRRKDVASGSYIGSTENPNVR